MIEDHIPPNNTNTNQKLESTPPISETPEQDVQDPAQPDGFNYASFGFDESSVTQTELELPSADDVSSTEVLINNSKAKIESHQQKAHEKMKQLSDQSPEISNATNGEELKKSVIEAEMEANPDITEDQAEERYEDFRTKLLIFGDKVLKWLEGGIKNSSFAKLIDFILSGKSEAGFSSGVEATESSNKLGQNEFARELKHQDSFVKALSNAYESGDERLMNLKGFNLSIDNLRAAQNGDREAYVALLTELNSNFSGAQGEENWAAFKKKFAESMNPGKTNIELDDSIKDMLNQMVKGDKFDQYLEQVNDSQDDSKEDQRDADQNNDSSS